MSTKILFKKIGRTKMITGVVFGHEKRHRLLSLQLGLLPSTGVGVSKMKKFRNFNLVQRTARPFLLVCCKKRVWCYLVLENGIKGFL